MKISAMGDELSQEKQARADAVELKLKVILGCGYLADASRLLFPVSKSKVIFPDGTTSPSL